MTRSELLQKAKPILFNTEMVRAILDGRKTVTRRRVKYKYSNTEMRMRTDKYGTRLIEIQKEVEGETHGKNPDGSTWHKLLGYIEPKPPYKKEDILYVRETWDNLPVTPDGTYCGYDRYYYRADGDLRPDGWKGNWKPSIHMPKRAARIFLRVTDVLVERLQDISEDGVVAEGAEPLIRCPREHAIIEPDGTTGDMCWNAGYCKQCDYINKSYGELFGEIVWNSTIKKSDLDRYGWDANPFVWVIEFERVKVMP